MVWLLIAISLIKSIAKFDNKMFSKLAHLLRISIKTIYIFNLNI